MCTKPIRKYYRLFHFINNILTIFPPKRSSTLNQLKEQDSKCPYINFIIIWFLLYHFWGHVFISAAKCASKLQNCCKTKITEFSMVIFCEQNVLRLCYVKQTLISLCMYLREWRYYTPLHTSLKYLLTLSLGSCP